MRTAVARNIRQGIEEARRNGPVDLSVLVILNSRYFSPLAVRAFNQYRWRRMARGIR